VSKKQANKNAPLSPPPCNVDWHGGACDQEP
jgi:hypothetical protein